jgi:hypothetical protein|tara:strand:+ start:229 stop:771 length:543 start_codon:yes stop_codon:yes gene_type:complete
MIRLLFTITFILSPLMVANDKAGTCASIENDKNRLVCYDHFFKYKSVESNKDIRNNTSSRLNAKESRHQNKTQKINPNKETTLKKDEDEFGLTEFEKRKLKPAPDSDFIKSSITSALRARSGKTRFKLDNGQIWESQSTITKARERTFVSKKNVRIEKGRFGFWMIEPESKNKTKVKRIS